MKKLLVILVLTVFITTLTSFSSNISNKLTTTNSISESTQQQQVVPAYALCGGNWYSGQIAYIITDQGYKPLYYWFNDFCGRQLQGQFYNERFVPLNPNNQLAKQNNWTHTISLNGQATAYLTLY